MMKLFNSTQLKEWDRYTCKEQRITSLQLMERAGTACASFVNEWLKDHPAYSDIAIICGTGNNGGDGLAIARLLSLSGLDVKVYIVSLRNSTPDFEVNLTRLTEETPIHIQHLKPDEELPSFSQNVLLLDCILGTGLNRPVSGWLKTVIDHVNLSEAYIISIDIPSGLPSEFTENSDLSSFIIVKARRTLTFQQPKRSFMFSESNAFTGEFEILDIGLSASWSNQTDCEYFFTRYEDAALLLKPRLKFSHKGSYGHALIVAGSYGKMGAAVLCGKAAMQTGCGLLTAYIPEAGYQIMQTALPEVMVITDPEKKHITHLPDAVKYSAIGIGPGIGTDKATGYPLIEWLHSTNKPLVIDADALNIIASHMATGVKKSIPAGAIITPHPKEFDRLAGGSDSSFGRLIKQKQFAKNNRCVVILKGAFTSIALPDRSVFFNSSGNPLLATGGSGDVLTGIITSFLAQGYQASDAAILGVFLHGHCADLRHNKGHATMLASGIIEELPVALHSLIHV